MLDEKERWFKITSTDGWSVDIKATSPKRAKDKLYYVRYRRSPLYYAEYSKWSVREVEPNFIVKLWRKFYNWLDKIKPLKWLE
jgi:hypothetical protein